MKLRTVLAGAVIVAGLGSLAACSGGNFFAEREPWRKEAEARCLGAGAVREGPGVVRISPISGPGVCGADHPFRVSSLGVAGALSFDEPRPPGTVPGGRAAVPWPVNDPADAPGTYQPRGGPRTQVDTRPLPPPGSPPASKQTQTYDFRRPYGTAPAAPRAANEREPLDVTSYDLPPDPANPRRPLPGARVSSEPWSEPSTIAPRRPPARENRAAPLGPARALPSPVASGTVTVTPNATLACPLVAVLDQWVATAVQPAAMHWFGQPVAEIKQISAYSCRGMNGNPNARISEHAFGNALDIAAFILADGRRVTVKDGWRGAPEEQGFLRDVQGAACERFTTVLAPGSNAFHYDHMHVDLMRRANGYRACNPRAVSGAEVAARVRAQYARQGRDPGVTGSVPTRKSPPPKRPAAGKDLDKVGHQLPLAIPGEDGED